MGWSELPLTRLRRTAAQKGPFPVIWVCAILAALSTVYWFRLRPWYLHWGTTETEHGERLPGYDLAPGPAVESTQAVTIDALPEEVWPWLVQIGQGRGGFYSYDRLEQLVGADIHNVEEIHPEYQDLSVGDEVLLAPKDYFAGSPDSWPVVASIAQYKYIVLRPPTDPPTYVWTFFLKPMAGDRTRVLVRMRSPSKPTLLGRIVEAVTWEPAHFIMQRKMLLGIKERAEGWGAGQS